MGGRAAAKNIGTALTSVAPDVTTRLIGDPSRLSQILMNLVGNAHEVPGRPATWCCVWSRILRCTPRGTTAVLGAEIQGIGIPAEKLKSDL